MTSNDEYVIQLLTERGYLTSEQVFSAAQSMKAENETTLDALLSSGAIDEDSVLGTIADQFGLKYCHLNGILYIDHMSAVERLACAAKLKKLAKANGGVR